MKKFYLKRYLVYNTSFVEMVFPLDNPNPIRKRYEDYIRFFCSAVAVSSAAFLTNPIDVVKVRIQLDNALSENKNIFANRKYKGLVRGVSLIVREEGFKGLYKGVVPSVLRDGTYSTLRLGSYEPAKNFLGASSVYAPLWKKLLAGAIVGGISSAICNPTDVVKIRMQAEGALQIGEKPRYNSTFSAFRDILKTEGVRGLWKGVVPTVIRASILTASQIPTYDHTKCLVLRNNIMDDGLRLHFVASMFSGLVTAFMTNPVDVIKTRIMSENVVANKSLVYVSTTACFAKILKSEGVLGFYKGFMPNWMRLGPHTVITFLIFERLRYAFGLKPL
ncbi:mitochondrial substrate carrier family protein ucpB [Hydra vulgaris]|uniref:Mitochondrial substrate carrier family protein ucpB n=1 Tax=Hydra vulgaris TaxID=6087 RepID=A0ABM4CDG4_HYDVU